MPPYFPLPRPPYMHFACREKTTCMGTGTVTTLEHSLNRYSFLSHNSSHLRGQLCPLKVPKGSTAKNGLFIFFFLTYTAVPDNITLIASEIALKNRLPNLCPRIYNIQIHNFRTAVMSAWHAISQYTCIKDYTKTCY